MITGSKDLDGNLINIITQYNIKRIKSYRDVFNCIKKIYFSNKVYFNSFFSFKNTIFFLFLSIFLNKKIILAPRGELYEENLNIKKKIYLLVFSFFKKNIQFHCTSVNEKNSIKKILKIKNKNLITIRNIIGKDKIDMPIKKKTFKKFIYLSRIDKKKNLLGLCKTMSKFKKFDKKIIIDLYGHIYDNDYFLECKKYFFLLKKKNIFIDYKNHLDPEKVEKILPKYIALIHPSFNENFGHVIIESLRSGVPVIASKNVFFNNLQKNNCGYNINFNDSKKLEEVILEYLIISQKKLKKNQENCINYYNKFLEEEGIISIKYQNLLK